MSQHELGLPVTRGAATPPDGYFAQAPSQTFADVIAQAQSSLDWNRRLEIGIRKLAFTRTIEAKRSEPARHERSPRARAHRPSRRRRATCTLARSPDPPRRKPRASRRTVRGAA